MQKFDMFYFELSKDDVSQIIDKIKILDIPKYRFACIMLSTRAGTTFSIILISKNIIAASLFRFLYIVIKSNQNQFYSLKVAALLEYGRILGSAVVVFMIFLSHNNDENF